MTHPSHSSHPLSLVVQGPVLLPGDEAFDREAAVFNLTVTHRPQVIVGATCAEDIQAAVRFAKDNSLPVAVLNTGHGPSLSVPEEAVMITTRRMTGIRIDPSRRTARAEAGVRWGNVVDEAAKAGLAPLAGSSPQVGVVGYTLGGGVSVGLGRAYGWAADHVRRIEVVTADGELREVTPMSGGDLFWALRGGKGNFGVVTAIEFSLFPVTELYAGALHFPGDSAREVLAAYQRFTSTVPDQMTSSLVLVRAPDLPFVPEFMRGKLTVSVRVAFEGLASEGRELVAPLRAVAPLLLDTVAVMPVSQIASIANDPSEPVAAVEHFALLDELSPENTDMILDVVGPEADTRITLVVLSQLGGALGREPEIPNAVGRRDAAFALLALTTVEPHEVAADPAAGRELTDRLSPPDNARKHPAYLAPADASIDSVRMAYDTLTYERLRAVKTTYDPHNMFCLNHNIPPQD